MGPKGLFYYLKECQKRVIFFLGDCKVTFNAKAPYVKCDRHGLPTVIPGLLRSELITFKEGGLKGNKSFTVCILTLLSMYQVFNNKARPNLKSILLPFEGLTLSFEISKLKRAVRMLNIGKLHLKRPRLLFIEKASPNAAKASWGSSVDAIAFIFNPKTLYAYFMYACHVPGGLRWLLWLGFLILLGLPLVCFLVTYFFISKLLFGDQWVPFPIMAKLSVVHDKAGKARIVGITNWWIQVLLEPLHNAIFDKLRLIPMDGTFDQTKPVVDLVNSVPEGTIFHSFDLSSATDRLPVEVQADILNILFPFLGTLWKALLGSLWWQWKSLNKRVPLRYYKYAVGQPMGAYSSWAMLALSHHVLVQLAALNAGYSKRFTLYAVLGDDIVIADNDVAREYLVIMNSLGVSINLGKSLISPKFCEFAKRWIGPGVDVSPLGAGLILQTGRTKTFLAALLTQMHTIGIIPNLDTTLVAITSLPDQLKGQERSALWAAFGLNSFFLKGSHIGNDNFMSLLKWCFTQQGSLTSTISLVKASLVDSIYKDKVKAQSNLDNAVSIFLENFWKTQCSKGWPNRTLEFLLKMFSPGVWVYMYEFIQQQIKLDEAENSVSQDFTIEGLRHTLDNLPFAINVSNIDWWDVKAVKDAMGRFERIIKEYESLNYAVNGVALKSLLGAVTIGYNYSVNKGITPTLNIKLKNVKIKPKASKKNNSTSGVSKTNSVR
jgi:hypothetical protein